MSPIDQAIEQGIEAVNRGDYRQGKAALSWVLHRDPKNRVAWIWMACCVPEDEAKTECYRRASKVSS